MVHLPLLLAAKALSSRRNPSQDERLRRLERAARAGDSDALNALYASVVRIQNSPEAFRLVDEVIAPMDEAAAWEDFRTGGGGWSGREWGMGVSVEWRVVLDDLARRIDDLRFHEESVRNGGRLSRRDVCRILQCQFPVSGSTWCEDCFTGCERCDPHHDPFARKWDEFLEGWARSGDKLMVRFGAAVMIAWNDCYCDSACDYIEEQYGLPVDPGDRLTRCVVDYYECTTDGVVFHAPARRNPTRELGDAGIRELGRRAVAGDPEATRAWFRARQRAGGRDGLAAVEEERRWIWDVEQPRIEAAWEAERDRIDREAMTALRCLHPRIRRSRRKNLDSLSQWADQVAGTDVVTEVLAPFRQEKEAVHARFRAMADEVMDRKGELRELRLDLARTAKARPGPNELEFDFTPTATYRSTGYNADSYARRKAEDDVLWLQHMGFEARAEQEPGEPWGPGGPPRTPGVWGIGSYAWIRRGQGWRSYVKVAEPEDAMVLRAQLAAMKALDWDGYLAVVIPERRATGARHAEEIRARARGERSNPDEGLRRLERRAAQGDRDAADALHYELLRVGQPRDYAAEATDLLDALEAGEPFPDWLPAPLRELSEAEYSQNELRRGGQLERRPIRPVGRFLVLQTGVCASSGDLWIESTQRESEVPGLIRRQVTLDYPDALPWFALEVVDLLFMELLDFRYCAQARRRGGKPETECGPWLSGGEA